LHKEETHMRKARYRCR